jgi:hypothetical protein
VENFINKQEICGRRKLQLEAMMVALNFRDLMPAASGLVDEYSSILSSFQNIVYFGFFRFIDFDTHLDIHCIYI